MKIEKYILNTYTTVHPFAATCFLEEALFKKGYVVVMDDENTYHGILSICDLVKRPHKLVIDCVTEKERLSANDSIASTLDKFKYNHCSALPVFKNDCFIGVVERQELIDQLEIKVNTLYNESIISQNVKQSFINNISHEVRTPLNGLLGFLELITELDLNNDTIIKKEYSDYVRKSADRFLLIMNDLMDLARLNSGDNLIVETEEVCIEQIFSDLKEYFDLAVLASNKNITIHYTNPDSFFACYSDGKKIKHILYHLIDNAVKFSDRDSSVQFGYKTKDQYIEFFVQNKCTPISENRKEQIFNIFEREDTKNEELLEGLGIGLPLVKKLTELLNGKIEFVSDEVRTTFFCSIPLITQLAEVE